MNKIQLIVTGAVFAIGLVSGLADASVPAGTSAPNYDLMRVQQQLSGYDPGGWYCRKMHWRCEEYQDMGACAMWELHCSGN